MPDILYQEAMQKVADTRKIVIGIRWPSHLGQTLLREGYASKSFHIKAKSSMAGPTAGFVVEDPLLGKKGMHGVTEQRGHIKKAIASGVKTTPLFISDARVRELLWERGVMKLVRRAQPGIWHVSGDYSNKAGGAPIEFLLKREGELWGVNYSNGFPVEALTNPVAGVESIREGVKAAVTADYDLFGLFPHGENVVNMRPLNTGPRVLDQYKSNPAFMAKAKQHIDAVHHTGTQRREDEHLGNMLKGGWHDRVRKELNNEIKAAGYKGGALIHHNDESGNPFTPGPDYPLLFLIANQKAQLVSTFGGLKSLYTNLEKMGYSVEKNPGLI